MAENIDRTVFAPNLEIAVVRCKPTVENRFDFDPTAFYPYPPGGFFSPISGIAFNSDNQAVHA